MDSIIIPWSIGSGNIIISERDGHLLISSDVNDDIEREQVLTFQTVKGNAKASLLVRQKGSLVVLKDVNGEVLYDINNDVLKAKVESK